jgi:hypothetical protein
VSRQRSKISGGEFCPKCKLIMQRYEHGQNWKPKADQPYYFKFWDICTPCAHFQHYEAAKVHVAEHAEAYP